MAGVASIQCPECSRVTFHWAEGEGECTLSQRASIGRRRDWKWQIAARYPGNRADRSVMIVPRSRVKSDMKRRTSASLFTDLFVCFSGCLCASQPRFDNQDRILMWKFIISDS